MNTQPPAFDYGDDGHIPAGDNILTAISQMAQEQLAAQDVVTERQIHLDEAVANLKNIKTVRFPNLMMEAGQKKLTTAMGVDVEMKEVVRANIPEARQQEAFAWLAETNNDAVIKYELRADVGKGAEAMEKIQQVIEFGESIGISITCKPSVHFMTLSSLVRQRLEAGLDVPMDTLGAIVQKEVTVKISKRKT